MDGFNHWLDLITAAVGSFITAAVGVAMRHAHKVQRGEPFSWARIALDGPTVLFMGLLGGALGQYLTVSYAMPELFGSVIAASGGYLGPSIVDRILDWVERRAGK
jgi:uncharacterized membrane protein YjjP (DUF1212 family)